MKTKVKYNNIKNIKTLTKQKSLVKVSKDISQIKDKE